MDTENIQVSTSSISGGEARRVSHNGGFNESPLPERVSETFTSWYAQATMLDRYYFKSSVDNPLYHVKRKPVVTVTPRKINLAKYLEEPVAPVYQPPIIKKRLMPLKPEVFLVPGDKHKRTDAKNEKLRKFALAVNNRREANYQRKLADWYTYDERRVRRLLDYDRSFAKRKAKFERRKAIFLRRKAIVQGWTTLGKRAERRHGLLDFDNPYRKTTIEALGSARVTATCLRITQAHTQRGSELPVRYHITQLRLTGVQPGGWPIYSGSAVECGRGFRDQLWRATEGRRSEEKAFLLNKNFKKVSNQKVHIGNMLAERAKTMDMFRSAVVGIADFLKSNKSILKSIGNPTKFIANQFLAFKFGLEPLIHDIHGIGETLVDLQNETEGKDVQVVVRSNRKRRLEVTQNGLRIDGWIESSSVLKYEIDDPTSDARLLQMLGLVNPTEIAWEVMPWSFVIDWLVPVGDFLNRLTADVGLTFKTGTYTTRINAVVTTSTNSHPPFHPTMTPVINGGWQNGETWLFTGDATYLWNEHVREVVTNPYEGAALFTKCPVSVTHGLESVALTMQRLLKSK